MAKREMKYQYREALKDSLRKAESLVDDIFEMIDGGKTTDITLSFHVNAGKPVTVDYDIHGGATELYATSPFEYDKKET